MSATPWQSYAEAAESDAGGLASEIAELRREMTGLRADAARVLTDNENLRREIADLRALLGHSAAEPEAPAAPPPPPARTDRRRGSRRRVRLESCKVLTRNFEFVAEASLFDQSQSGCRLKLLDDTETPADIMLLRDVDGALLIGSARWRDGREIGVQILRILAKRDTAYPAQKLARLLEERARLSAFNRQRRV